MVSISMSVIEKSSFARANSPLSRWHLVLETDSSNLITWYGVVAERIFNFKAFVEDNEWIWNDY